MSRSSEQQEARRDFVDSALRAWDEYVKTGIAYGASDVHAWFLAKVSGKPARKPHPIARKPL
jgi:hypothetical protein